MDEVRLLVGTRKGVFILRGDGAQRRWALDGPAHGGWEAYHVQGDPADPDRLYAALWTAWHGTLIQRSRDGGRTWEPVGNTFAYADGDAVHQGFEGEPQPWRFKRVWHLEPVPAHWGPPGGAGGEAVRGAGGARGSGGAGSGDGGRWFAGVEDAALFRSADGGATWEEVPGLRRHPSTPAWQPGAGGLCLHTILFDPVAPGRLYVAISAAGVFRSEDGGQTWQPANRGLRATYTPEPEPEVGFCVHRIALHPARPQVLFMQKHFGVYRSDDAGRSWQQISGNLPSDFGYPIAVHPEEPDTVYVVPITDDTQHYPPNGELRVWRTRDGGGTWEATGRGLPDRHCYVNVLREAMATVGGDPPGIYVGTTGGQVYGSTDGGETWQALATHLPPVLSVEAQRVR